MKQAAMKQAAMKRMCRVPSDFQSRNRCSASAVLRHAHIVTDPEKLAFLHAEAERQRRRPDPD
jgi:hypothetical protein